jgi:hypothetical protein
MKPTFALDLTREAIALLHRTPKGWLTIGEVAFDAPDLGDALDYLRKTALGLSPLGVASKVILPNNQILYLELYAPGPSREDKRSQIMAGLVGRTPYDVEDLVFDWSGKGATVKVAVVARETLAEAEDFAVAHRMNPVSFVAIPDEGTFVGEVWFGPSAAADTILAPGEVVERDRDIMSVIAAATTAPIPEPEADVAAEPAAPQDNDPLPGLQEALEAEVTEADLAMEPPARPGPVALDSDELADPFAEEFDTEPAPAARAFEPVLPKSAAPEFAASESAAREPDALPDPVAMTPEPELAPARPELAAEVEEAPFEHVDDSAADPVPDAVAEPAAKPFATPDPVPSVLADDLQDTDVPPAPSPAAMFAFSSRRSTAPDATARPAAPFVAPPLPPGPPEARFTAPMTRPAPPARTFPGLVTAPSIPGTRAKPKSKATGVVPRPAGLAPVTVKAPARPGGTFGTTAPPRNRSGFIFMIMVGLLLLSLALVAAWASFFLTQAADEAETARVTDLAADVVDVPAIEDEMAADLQDPEDLAEVVPDPEPVTEVVVVESEAADLAADIDADLAVEDLPVNIGGDDTGLPPTLSVADAVAEGVTEPSAAEIAVAEDPAADPAATELAEADPAPETADPAPASTIATEVSGDLVPVEDQDEIFLSAMDVPPPALDALALPAPVAVADAAPEAPMPPPAFGTVYQFGPDGLLKPTPEGILSPAGVMLIAGKPPLLPPARSPVAEAAAAAAAPAPVAAADPASAPATAADASLVTAADPLAEAVPELLPEPDPAMAGFRPRPRPAGLVPAVDDGASLSPEAPASDITLRPLLRPAVVLAAAAAARPTETGADLGAQGASLTAQAEAKLAAAEALEAENPSIVAISMRPAARPTDLSRAVEAAVAAAVREPEPEAVVELAAAAPEAGTSAEEIDEPEVEGSAPAIPTKASVAKQATYKNAINLGKINLIGTYGTSSGRYALIRQANGSYKKVEVGDKIDGGVIKAITETEVRYQKGGKLLSLEMPKA